MEIGNSVRRNNKDLVILKSILWKTIIDIYNIEKKIDITPYLVSINIRGNIFLIKTNKPIINSELNNYKGKILENFDIKIKKLGLVFQELDIKFI